MLLLFLKSRGGDRKMEFKDLTRIHLDKPKEGIVLAANGAGQAIKKPQQ